MLHRLTLHWRKHPFVKPDPQTSLRLPQTSPFPTFTITGGLGLQNNSFNSTFNQASRAWSLGPSVNWPILDMGRNRANLELKKALQDNRLPP